jgi:hypothetical protein
VLQESAAEPWGSVEMRTEDPDAVRIVHVEVPIAPLRQGTQPGSWPVGRKEVADALRVRPLQ